MKEMNDFETDYLISWDFSENDLPCVIVTALHKDEKSNHIMGTVIGISHQKSGVVSLHQVLSDYEKREVAENLNKAKGANNEQREAENKVN